MRTFSLVDGTSDKFWHIDVADTSVTVHYGRTGTTGQRSTKEFATAQKANEHAEKQIASKVAKGYVEGAGSDEAITPTEVKLSQPRPPRAEPTASGSDASVAATAAAGAARAAVESSEPAADFGAEGLGLLLPALVRTAITGEVPEEALTPQRTPRPFTAAAETAWVNQHVVVTKRWHRVTLDFSDLPFDDVPTEDLERALWWDWWGQGEEQNAWGRWESLPLKQRNAFATRQATAHPEGPQESVSGRDVADLVAVAARLALTDPDRTLRAVEPGPDAQLGLRVLVVPHLSEEVRRDYEAAPVPEVTPNYFGRVDYNWHVPNRLFVLGRDAELLAELRSAQAAGESIPVELLYAIGDVATRLELLGDADNLYSASSAPHLLWLLGAEGLRLVRTGLRHEYADKEASVATIEVLAAMLHGPAAVDTFVDLALDSKSRGTARTWLLDHPVALSTWAGANTPSGRVKDLISGVVRELHLSRPGVLDAESPGVLGEVMRTVAAENALPLLGAEGDLPPWWTEAVAAEAATEVPPSKIKVPVKAPTWALPGAVPPLLLAEARLDDDQTTAVLLSAARGIGDPDLKPRPLVAAVRDRLTSRVRDQIATALVDGWLASGGASAHRAYFMAAGFLGHEGFALHLAPLVREWPGQSQHQRAVLGLDVLAATGTDTALGVISGIANKSKFKGVQKAARESMEKLAVLQGLSVHQLEDRVVPDGGLDERGYRVFTYGPRSFRVTLTPTGKLQVRDLDAEGKVTGKPRTALPAPNAKDDADVAKAAKADFTVLRKTVTDLAKVQTSRLEQAMVSGRTWTGAEHEQFLARHPILNSLIRPLVWSITTPDGERTLARVTEEQTYLSITDDDIEMPAEATVTLAHRLSLTDAEADAWRQHLVDYDLTSPVEQLERATFALPAATRGIEMANLPAGDINPLSLMGTLEKLGWRRGNPADAGVVSFLSLTFEALGVAAVLGITDGLWTGMIGESGDQKLETLRVCPADQVEHMWYVNDRDQVWLDWAEVDHLVVSETRRSIAALEEKMA